MYYSQFPVMGSNSMAYARKFEAALTSLEYGP